MKVVIVYLVCLLSLVWAGKRHIHLHSEIIDTHSHPPFHHDQLRTSKYSAKTLEERLSDPRKHLFLVHTDEDAPREARTNLVKEISIKHNLDTKQVVSAHTMLLYMDHSTADIISKMEHILWVGYFHPHHKKRLKGKITQDSELSITFASKTESESNSPHDIVSEVCHALGLSDQDFHLNLVGKKAILKLRNSASVQHRSELLASISSHLSEHPHVKFVHHRGQMVFHNNYARGIIINDNENLPDFKETSDFNPLSSEILGYNQVIGIVDSGLDYRNCFFANQAGPDVEPAPFRTWSETPSEADMMNQTDFTTQRKIVSYVAYGDDVDVGHGGHGTHVAGSAAGYPAVDLTFLDEYSGMAIASKLAIFDIANPDEFTIPPGIDEHIFPWMRAAGARIISNSWGTLDGEYYNDLSAEVDKYMHDNKEVLLLFSAGNTGGCADNTDSIKPPADAKSCLTVGASLNSAKSWQWVASADDLYSTYSSEATFDSSSMAYFSSMGPTSDNRIKPDVVGPGYYIASQRDNQTDGAVCGDTIGDDISYAITMQAGTSMASPVVAGAASLVRQYFTSGFFPSGAANPSNAFTPSGGLLKNILINGAINLDGDKISTGEGCSQTGPIELEPRPSSVQGFGRVQLNQVLYIAGASRKLHIPSLVSDSNANYHDRVIQDGEHSYDFCGYAGGEIRITLVWVDAPAEPPALPALINDLSLKVVHGLTTIWGNSQNSVENEPDTVNTVEAVYITFDDATDFTVSVVASTISASYPDQPYSLVLSGSISEGACSGSSGAGQPEPVITSNSLHESELEFDFSRSKYPNSSSAGTSLACNHFLLVIGVIAIALTAL